MRTLALAFFVALAIALPFAPPSGGGPSSVGAKQFLVDPDPRLCPSPRCGGYWASLANRETTLCPGGERRSRCYAAAAIDEDAASLTVPAGALVRGELVPWRVDGLGDLGRLVVEQVREPFGTKRSGVVYRVRDLGIRCVRAPCFSFRASRVNTAFTTTLSGLDLSAAALGAKEQARAERELRLKDGLYVVGRIERTLERGRQLRAWRVYLSATPRG